MRIHWKGGKEKSDRRFPLFHAEPHFVSTQKGEIVQRVRKGGKEGGVQYLEGALYREGFRRKKRRKETLFSSKKRKRERKNSFLLFRKKLNRRKERKRKNILLRKAQEETERQNSRGRKKGREGILLSAKKGRTYTEYQGGKRGRSHPSLRRGGGRDLLSSIFRKSKQSLRGEGGEERAH